jgi:uncharacterized protein with PIN domain
MSEKCAICGAKIEETFLGKPKGSIVKVLKDEKNEKFYVCDGCQKKHGEHIKEEVAKLE